MSLGGILILLLLIVSLVVFIYLMVMTARGWGVLNTLLLCTLFIECWVFLIFTAGVQYRRVEHTRQADKWQKDAEVALKETQELLYGTSNANTAAQEAVLPVKGKLRRLTADRGRVWRELAFLQNNGGQFLLQITNNRAAADAEADVGAAAPPPTSESLPQNLVVYAFAEETSESGYPLPVFYLGEFVIAQSQGGQVTLRPTLPLNDAQMQRIASGAAASWMLYELLPIDSHDAFADKDSSPSSESIFGRMDAETLQSLYASVPEGLRSKIVDAYVRDGLRADDDDEPANVWVQINMTKVHQVDVDSQDEANATVSGYFDPIGRSVDLRLKREDGKPVELTPEMVGKLIVLKEEPALELIAAGKAILLQRIFVRKLNDYEEAFNRNIVREHELAERINLVKRETVEIDKANQLGMAMIAFRQVENQKLVSDLANYKKEVAVLNEEAAATETQLADLKAQMSQLYRSIQTRRAELAP